VRSRFGRWRDKLLGPYSKVGVVWRDQDHVSGNTLDQKAIDPGAMRAWRAKQPLAFYLVFRRVFGKRG
jgi:hypothetical protein